MVVFIITSVAIVIHLKKSWVTKQVKQFKRFGTTNSKFGLFIEEKYKSLKVKLDGEKKLLCFVDYLRKANQIGDETCPVFEFV